NPTTVVSRINGADGNQAISAVGTGIFEDVSNTDSVSSGDLLNISITTPSGSGSFFFSRIRSIFEVESETVKLFASMITTTNSGTYYGRLGGYQSDNPPATTENNVQHLIRSPGSFHHFGARVFTNAKGTTTINFRK